MKNHGRVIFCFVVLIIAAAALHFALPALLGPEPPGVMAMTRVVGNEHGSTAASAPSQTPIDSGPQRSLHGWSLFWTFLGIFAGGAALNLTPCVYPLIPITVSYFGSRATEVHRPQSQIVTHALAYVIGLAVMNSTLGVVAALTGGLLGATLQSPLTSVAVAAVLVFFSTSLFGFWEMRAPTRLVQLAAKPYTGYFGSFFMGITLGLVAAPCIGPFVIGLLTWVAGSGSPWLGFSVFFTLSLGLGVPLFFLALFSGQLQRLPRSGEWMVWIRKFMGWVLVAMAAYFLQPLLSDGWQTCLYAAVVLAAGIHMGWADKTQADSRPFTWFKKSVGLASWLVTILLVLAWANQSTPGIAWRPYSDQALQEAQELKKPVMIDFFAQWCQPCRELDRLTFHDPSVVEQATNNFVTLKVDLTHTANPFQEGLLQHYGIRGVPTVLLLDRTGRERRDLRVVGFVPPRELLDRMAELSPNDKRP